MNRTFKAAVAALVLFVGFAVPVAAGPYEDAYAAYDRGDYATALQLWRPFAEQGNADAQFYLALMYDNGQGVAQNYTTAVNWYRKAAEQGDAFAQLNLALKYVKGQGVAQNYAAAMNWYRKAADQGVAKAQFNLGLMYDNGEGVAQNYAAAANWFRKAADQGDALAQFNLGVMYFNGQGVAQNYVLAYMWLSLAAAKGDADAAKNRGIVAARMNPAQIAEAQKLAAAWQPKMANATPPFDPSKAFKVVVPLKIDSGIFVVPVQINGTMTLDFVIDSGAADVSVPADVVSTLKRAGTIKESDFIGQRTYVLADGSKSRSATFTIRSLRVGDMVVENVTGSVSSSQGSLLLGQSFLERFKSWSVDNTKHELLLEPR